MSGPLKAAILGFPRVGEYRELKRALEAHWSGRSSLDDLTDVGRILRTAHRDWQSQAGLDWVGANDFSYYDGMLDSCVLFDAIPERFRQIADPMECYFAMARGSHQATALSMKKWFNTNYHYLVPELAPNQSFNLNPAKVLTELRETLAVGLAPKVTLIGPLTFLRLSLVSGNSDGLELLPDLLPQYEALIRLILKEAPLAVIQIDEPILVKDPDAALLLALSTSYARLCAAAPSAQLLVATYFEHATEALAILKTLPLWGIALDFVHGPDNLSALAGWGKQKLWAGVVDGRNVWINDYRHSLALLNHIATAVGVDQLVVSSSCSLLHVPYRAAGESALAPEVHQRLAFATEKLAEVATLARLFTTSGSAESQSILQERDRLLGNFRGPVYQQSSEHDRVPKPTTPLPRRLPDAATRKALHGSVFSLPLLPTTTIGSFPQTGSIRALRAELKAGAIDQASYDTAIRQEIADCIKFQEELDIDVLVHGEFERNDMVEYFGERLAGFAFSANGWVQSYGSRCVKPPLIHNDVSRPQAMTVDTIRFAQSQTQRIVKGMLTGPVTILNWSFVRDDLPRSEVARQLALALRAEVLDLEAAGIRIIQVDEAAFKEGYPLRASRRPEYEHWAVEAFLISTKDVRAETQIHTHMCYSEFADIMATIKAMDADVISIETSRGGNRLLTAFTESGYDQDLGPGVYDIHSPRVPDQTELVAAIRERLQVVAADKLWINPDCGLKTRRWEEVRPALAALVAAAKTVRTGLAQKS